MDAVSCNGTLYYNGSMAVHAPPSYDGSDHAMLAFFRGATWTNGLSMYIRLGDNSTADEDRLAYATSVLELGMGKSVAFLTGTAVTGLATLALLVALVACWCCRPHVRAARAADDEDSDDTDDEGAGMLSPKKPTLRRRRRRPRQRRRSEAPHTLRRLAHWAARRPCVSTFAIVGTAMLLALGAFLGLSLPQHARFLQRRGRLTDVVDDLKAILDTTKAEINVAKNALVDAEDTLAATNLCSSNTPPASCTDFENEIDDITVALDASLRIINNTNIAGVRADFEDVANTLALFWHVVLAVPLVLLFAGFAQLGWLGLEPMVFSRGSCCRWYCSMQLWSAVIVIAFLFGIVASALAFFSEHVPPTCDDPIANIGRLVNSMVRTDANADMLSYYLQCGYSAEIYHCANPLQDSIADAETKLARAQTSWDSNIETALLSAGDTGTYAVISQLLFDELNAMVGRSVRQSIDDIAAASDCGEARAVLERLARVLCMDMLPPVPATALAFLIAYALYVATAFVMLAALATVPAEDDDDDDDDGIALDTFRSGPYTPLAQQESAPW